MAHDRPKKPQITSVRGRLLLNIKESQNLWFTEEDFAYMLKKSGKHYKGSLKVCVNNLRWAFPALRDSIEVKEFNGRVWVRWLDKTEPATDPKEAIKPMVERLVEAYGDCQDIIHEIVKQLGWLALTFGKIRVETNDILEKLTNQLK